MAKRKQQQGLYHDGIVRDKARIARNGEIFTPMALVNEMIDAAENNGCTAFSDPSKTSCDPCMGNGQFIIGMIKRKIKRGMTFEQAARSTFGMELMQDNVDVTRQRVMDICGYTDTIYKIVTHNLIQGDALVDLETAWEA